MHYEIGKVYAFDGVERRVIALDGAGFPVTSSDLGASPLQEKKEKDRRAVAALREQLTQEIRKELLAKTEGPDHTALLRLLPLDRFTKEQLLSLAVFLKITLPEKTGEAEMGKEALIQAMLGGA